MSAWWYSVSRSATKPIGIYAIALASGEEPNSRLIVRVGSGDTRMRGFVSGEGVDISPTS